MEQGGEDVRVIDIGIIRLGTIQARLDWDRFALHRTIAKSAYQSFVCVNAVHTTAMRPRLVGFVRALFLLGIAFLFHDRALSLERDQPRRSNKD